MLYSQTATALPQPAPYLCPMSKSLLLSRSGWDRADPKSLQTGCHMVYQGGPPTRQLCSITDLSHGTGEAPSLHSNLQPMNINLNTCPQIGGKNDKPAATRTEATQHIQQDITAPGPRTGSTLWEWACSDQNWSVGHGVKTHQTIHLRSVSFTACKVLHF